MPAASIHRAMAGSSRMNDSGRWSMVGKNRYLDVHLSQTEIQTKPLTTTFFPDLSSSWRPSFSRCCYSLVDRSGIHRLYGFLLEVVSPFHTYYPRSSFLVPRVVRRLLSSILVA
jgi:hypothetical protein